VKFETIKLLAVIPIKFTFGGQLQIFLATSVAAEKRFQSLSVEHIGLDKIFDGEMYYLFGLVAFNFKVEPLEVRIGVGIWSEVELVL
jgi:hypothetical protein